MPVSIPVPAKGTDWPAGPPVACPAADALMTDVRQFGKTYQLLAIRGGKIIYEAHGQGKTAESTSVSWSMAKSWLHALVGVAIHHDVLPADLERPVQDYWPRCPAEWTNDARAGITMSDLLTMRPNLRWREDYVDGGESDVIPMLSGYAGTPDGPASMHSPPGARCAESMGLWAAMMPATDDAPGDTFNYSSGFSNLISDILTTALCPHGGATERKAATLKFFEENLAGPIGCGGKMQPKFDASGTFVGSSWLYGTARDFARLPTLYMLDGCWGAVRVLPEGWAEHAYTVSAPETESGGPKYGAHWWIDGNGPHHTFSCNGYNVQRAIAVPSHELVVVRLGVSPDNAENQGIECAKQIGRIVTELCRTARI